MDLLFLICCGCDHFANSSTGNYSTVQSPALPWLNVLFILADIGAAVSAIISSPIRALYGIGLILAGLPIYAIYLVANRITQGTPPKPAHL
jgi:hypothetical protein